MADFDFAAAAEKLAHVAVHGDRKPLADVAAPFVKSAGGLADYLQSPAAHTYLFGGLGGLAAGGLIGAMQPRRKGRNALLYGLTGGLGGLGLAHLANAAGAGQGGGGGGNGGGGPGDDKPGSSWFNWNNAERVLNPVVGGTLGTAAYRGISRLQNALPARLRPKTVQEMRQAWRAGMRSEGLHSKHQRREMQQTFEQASGAANDAYSRAQQATLARHKAELAALGNAAFAQFFKAPITARHQNELAAAESAHAAATAQRAAQQAQAINAARGQLRVTRHKATERMRANAVNAARRRVAGRLGVPAAAGMLGSYILPYIIPRPPAPSNAPQ